MSLALLGSPLDDEAPEAPTEEGAARGRLLGERYQIRELLGRGGMGEVYRAFDLKLRVDVALKSVRKGRELDGRAHELVRREVRAAREVVSPNVCRIFDLVDEDGEELLSMEYIDGTTLGETLRSRGPLALSEAREIASQFLSGLEAIHQAGLVHRDFKPENVMITRAGRVVVMDFGVAKAPTTGPTWTVSGTPAYMAPEQARGDPVDARADVFSAGIVLAEMVSVGGVGALHRRQALWRDLRETPPRVPEGPWAAVLRQALSALPEARHASARALARALEEVTLRLPGFEERRPYPGLASFTEEDAEFFFGREVEVETLWKKLKRPRLLGLIGPSGAGKSSFLRAGLLPTLPSNWKAVLASPGTRPFQALAQALVPQCADDTEALQALVRFEEMETAVSVVSRWRKRHEHALVIVDQFEELFTQNPTAVQVAFAQLLGRLVLEADAHVVVSLRDDFLIHCHGHEALAPILSELTLLGPLGEGGLRRALVQPALSCGYHFEDEALVDEMVHEVVKERGALPLLAFAASRLWDKRDREKGLLTRDAYREIGGVGGALAQHAETTLEQIGRQRIPLVRELFRNLVTSQGTRAVRERSELLSVFDQAGRPETRAEAETVLNALIDARLLTSYERAGDEGERRQEVEIIHESLLTAWPRLVRWQTQDADGAQVRDQLRQAAQVWQERGRPEDLLWSGTAYRDFAVWREQYSGGLSATEEAFAEAAARRAGRRRRRRQLAVAALLAAVAAVAVTTSLLWLRSEASLQKAEAETLRAEAGKLLVMGEREFLNYPTGALAYTLKSLELADTEAGRLLALRVLQSAPVARLAPISEGYEFGNAANEIDFSPNAEWVAWGGTQNAEVIRRDGARRLVLGGYPRHGGRNVKVRFGSASDLLVASREGDIRLWSIPEGRELRQSQMDDGPTQLHMARDAFLTLAAVGRDRIVRSWPLRAGEPRLVGSMEAQDRLAATGRAVAYASGRAVYLRSIEDWGTPHMVLEQPTDIRDLALSPDAAHVATSDGNDEIRIWSTVTQSARPERVFKSPEPPVGLDFDPAGRWVYAQTFGRGYPTHRLFSLLGPSMGEPVALQKGDTNSAGTVAFEPSGHWLATTHGKEVAFWPLDTARAQVLRTPEGPARSVVFAPDGKSLFSLSVDGSMRARPLVGTDSEVRVLAPGSRRMPALRSMILDPSGRMLAASGVGGRMITVRMDGGAPQPLKGFPERSLIGRPAFSHDGRLLAAGLLGGARSEKLIRVWDLETGSVRALRPLPGAGEMIAGGICAVRFVGRERLLATVVDVGVVSVDLSKGTNRVLVAHSIGDFAMSPDGRFGVGMTGPKETRERPAVRFDLVEGKAQPLSSHGTNVSAVAFDPSGSLIATGSLDGTIRIGRTSGEEPHLLLGQEGAIYSLAFSPDGRWLAAAGEAFAIHIFPVPDVSRPPLHRRPHDTLLSALGTHTNLRAIPDPKSATGYRLAPDKFPGWATLPEW
jgi:WD40 repeat protein